MSDDWVRSTPTHCHSLLTTERSSRSTSSKSSLLDRGFPPTSSRYSRRALPVSFLLGYVTSSVTSENETDVKGRCVGSYGIVGLREVPSSRYTPCSLIDLLLPLL
jgi:hypothetical protein